jgi:signal transduction histidine kinase
MPADIRSSPVRSTLSSATLGLLLLAAAIILLGGQRLARRTELVRVAGDRAPIRTVAAEMEQEMARLERLYEGDLRQLVAAGSSPAADQQAVWQQCDRIIGVSQWSLIWTRPGVMTEDVHIPIDLQQAGRMPEPAFHIDPAELPHPRVLLSSQEMPKSPGWGWIDEPGKPLFFWQWSRRAVVVLLIDPEPLRAALEPWFADWSTSAFGPLRAAHAPFALLGPDDRRVASVGARQVGEPDFLLPVHSRFGTWQLAAWDPVQTLVRYDAPTQFAAAALAVLVALLGVFGFVQQRRMLALAAQRVSFVNRVSHELRTPLTNILLNLDLAAEGMSEDMHEPARRLGLVREEAQRLGRLIENVLTFSGRRERRRETRKPRAGVPSSIIAAVVEQFAASFARRGLTVRHTGEASVTCLIDADALAQILANLLSNVEKYVPGGVVEIAATVEHAVLTVTVTDQGPGIAAEEAQRIFRPFERLGSRINEGATGTGLGLAIARDLAEGAGGSLRLIPSSRGASFQLKLLAPPAPGLEVISVA